MSHVIRDLDYLFRDGVMYLHALQVEVMLRDLADGDDAQGRYEVAEAMRAVADCIGRLTPEPKHRGWPSEVAK